MEIQNPEPNRRPRFRVKNKGGAPKGNRNAFKHGAFTREKLAERRALHREVRTLVLRIRASVALAMLATMGRKPKVTVTRIETTSSPRRPNS